MSVEAAFDKDNYKIIIVTNDFNQLFFPIVSHSIKFYDFASTSKSRCEEEGITRTVGDGSRL